MITHYCVVLRIIYVKPLQHQFNSDAAPNINFYERLRLANQLRMLKSARVVDTASAQKFIQLWSGRYHPDLSIFPDYKGGFPVVQLVQAASELGRIQTVSKVRGPLQYNCEQAGFKAYSFYLGMSINLTEAKQLAQLVKQVYEQILEVYLQQPPPGSFLKFIEASRALFLQLAMPSLQLPTIQHLAERLEPALLQLQANSLTTQHPHILGFLTTQFRFSTQAILQSLTVYEQVLLTPYLKFVEEQICMPWQRICATASKYSVDSPILLLIEKLLAASDDIAQRVYGQTTQRYSTYHSRRGMLTHPDVATSMLRDLVMFQSYLGLTVLEQQMHAVKEELLPLCQVVLPSVGLKWEQVEQILELLLGEIQARVAPEQQEMLFPYTQAMRTLFTVSTPNETLWKSGKYLLNQN